MDLEEENQPQRPRRARRRRGINGRKIEPQITLMTRISLTGRRLLSSDLLFIRALRAIGG
jgi:hypothetical protein